MNDADDDRLAPVTSLFGRRDGRRGGASAPDGSTGLHNAPASHEALASDEASVSQDAWVDDASPGDDEAPPNVDADAVVADQFRPDLPDRSRPHLTALPTYAAFAATTESEAAISVAAVTPSVPESARRTAEAPASAPTPGSFGGDDDAELESESIDAASARAENISLHALSRRGVSSREMESTLRSRDLPDAVILVEIERLEKVGLLDDFALAENLVQTKQDRKGMGKAAISSELRQRGIAQEAIDAALADIDDDEEQARADEWAVKRSGQLRGLDQTTAERRLNAFLMRRGYRSEVIRRAVEKALPRGGGSGVRFR